MSNTINIQVLSAVTSARSNHTQRSALQGTAPGLKGIIHRCDQQQWYTRYVSTLATPPTCVDNDIRTSVQNIPHKKNMHIVHESGCIHYILQLTSMKFRSKITLTVIVISLMQVYKNLA